MKSLPDDIQFQVEDRGDYLYIAVSGPRDSREISVAYWERIIDECKRRGTRRLMVYENLGDHEGERDIQSLVEWLIDEGLGELKVAFVVGRIELLAQMEFGEILAMERGAHGRVFADRALAERWLRHG